MKNCCFYDEQNRRLENLQLLKSQMGFSKVICRLFGGAGVSSLSRNSKNIDLKHNKMLEAFLQL